jgi:hypothetical protein
MVSGIGSAVFKDPIGTTAFGRAARSGYSLAHLDDGFSYETAYLTSVTGGEK